MIAAKRFCVFCGSSLPSDPSYRAAAAQLGTMIGQAGHALVYGGGRVGLMGLLADAALNAGAHVTGVIPLGLQEREVGHTGLSEMVVVEDMHLRKRRMFELCDAVVVLPGGLGTLDEAFEAITLRQLGLINKPIVVLNIDDFWTPLLALIDHVVATGFTRPEARKLYAVVSRTEDVIPRCLGFY